MCYLDTCSIRKIPCWHILAYHIGIGHLELSRFFKFKGKCVKVFLVLASFVKVVIDYFYVNFLLVFVFSSVDEVSISDKTICSNSTCGWSCTSKLL